MELLQTIALLCQISAGGATASRGILNVVFDYQVKCQQSYINCVLTKPDRSKEEALQRCILEK